MDTGVGFSATTAQYPGLAGWCLSGNGMTVARAWMQECVREAWSEDAGVFWLFAN